MPQKQSCVIPKLAYTFDEAAEATGFDTATIKTMADRGEIVTRYAEGVSVIRIQDLDDWLSALPARRGGHRLDSTPTAKTTFRTPEEVAPELGISKTSLRSYCRLSGICTRGSRGKILIHEDDIPRLVSWIKEHRRAEDRYWNSEPDNFSQGSGSKPLGNAGQVDNFA